MSFKYNADGIRTEKHLSGKYGVYYRLDGDRVIEMRMTGADINTRYVFTYDAQGRPYTVTCYSDSSTSGITYYYVLNLQGDVIQIVGVENNVIANYRYDAWGNVLAVTDKNGSKIASATHIGNINPLRYRGYYYDVEIGFYYLNSRYYDPLMKRFINADGTVSTGQGFAGYNMFAYCGNNPVMCSDPSGQFFGEFWEFVEEAAYEVGQTMEALLPAYAGCGGAAIADGPLPFGDAIGIAGAVVLTIGAIGVGINEAYKSRTKSNSTPEIKDKTNVDAIPKINDRRIIFPVNPDDFNPVGLKKVPRDGTKNGGFVSWMDPITNTEVFRWDENPNYSNGPHYHIYGEGHYIPGIDCVPEPYSWIYFPMKL